MTTTQTRVPPIQSSSHTSFEDLFFRNLLLLGFDRDQAEKKHGVPLGKDMFHGCNVKAMEIVFHFLFSHISPDATKDIFRALWPITDKKQSREFKTLAHKFISDLEKAGHIPNGTVRLSHLHTCSGERFYNLVWLLSTHALKCVAQRNGVSLPNLPKLDSTTLPYFQNIKMATKLRVNNETATFLERAEKFSQDQQHWREFAGKLEQQYRALLNQKARLERDMRDFDSMMARNAGKSNQENISPENAAHGVQVWTSLAKNIKENKTNRDMVTDILEKRANTHRIEGKDLKLDKPTMEEVANVLGSITGVIPDPFVDGKLDISNLTQLWTESVRAIDSKLRHLATARDSSETLESTAAIISQLDRTAEQHEQHLVTLRQSTSEMKATLGDMKLSVKELDAKAAVARSKNIVMASTNSTPRKPSPLAKSSVLDLVPPTPSRKQYSPTRPVAVSDMYAKAGMPSATAQTTRRIGPFDRLEQIDVVTGHQDEQTSVANMAMAIRAEVKRAHRSPNARKPYFVVKTQPQYHQVAVEEIDDITKYGTSTSTTSPIRGGQVRDSLRELGLSPIQADSNLMDDLTGFNVDVSAIPVPSQATAKSSRSTVPIEVPVTTQPSMKPSTLSSRARGDKPSVSSNRSAHTSASVSKNPTEKLRGPKPSVSSVRIRAESTSRSSASQVVPKSSLAERRTAATRSDTVSKIIDEYNNLPSTDYSTSASFGKYSLDEIEDEEQAFQTRRQIPRSPPKIDATIDLGDITMINDSVVNEEQPQEVAPEVDTPEAPVETPELTAFADEPTLDEEVSNMPDVNVEERDLASTPAKASPIVLGRSSISFSPVAGASMDEMTDGSLGGLSDSPLTSGTRTEASLDISTSSPLTTSWRSAQRPSSVTRPSMTAAVDDFGWVDEVPDSDDILAPLSTTGRSSSLSGLTSPPPLTTAQGELVTDEFEWTASEELKIDDEDINSVIRRTSEENDFIVPVGRVSDLMNASDERLPSPTLHRITKILDFQ